MVRTGPNEISVHDSEAIASFDRTLRHSSKDPWNCNVGIPKGTALLTDPKEHRSHHVAVSRYIQIFSKSSLLPLLQDRLDEVCQALRSAADQRRDINLSQLIRSFSYDLVGTFVLGAGHQNRYMEQHDFGEAKLRKFRGIFRLIELVKHFPILRSRLLLHILPNTIAQRVVPLEMYRRVRIGIIFSA